MWSLIEAFLGIAPARLRDVRFVCVDIKEDTVNVHKETFPASVEHLYSKYTIPTPSVTPPYVYAHSPL